ncbi:VRR-NUC domain-containing protein [Gorillibacterium sp. sgz5001074]|uniref:VRR-NUC domain-containing protein n=1 Tax=Gorillibacterium sp. sgz5001074 TaxID=3446695 RepID=UPI003F66B722
MRERDIENTLVKAVKAAGGLCWKFVSPGMSGVPDRIVLMPGMPACFVELKAPGGKPTPLQLKRHDELQARGFQVDIVRSKEEAKAYVEGLTSG